MIHFVLSLLFDIITYGIFLYSFILVSSYIILSILSISETRRYLKKNQFVNYRVLTSTNFAPSVSILAPAYNEGANIIENVRSLLSINYNNFEVIIINDGSKDDSLQKLILAYDLDKTEYFLNEQLQTKPVRGIYKSRNPVFKRLVVVDKENGGKADALNVGVNVSANSYIACIDVDCILEQDALQKMVKPFLEEAEKRVIATGGVIRIANSCKIEDGKLVEVGLPNKFLPRVQILEYIRAFLLGRMAWARLDGLLLISGAFGLFDKEIVINAGGYDHNTVGEDMELVVRMRRYMHENNLPYKVSFIPDPLCWTEAPESFKILGRQRNRWTRGTIETLAIHKVMFFNRKYGMLGMLSYPYWYFFELMAPLIEFFGTLFFVFLVLAGIVNWTFFLALLGLIYSFGLMFSILAIYTEEITYHQYTRKRDVFKLIFVGIIEPFIFHPFVVWAAIKGNKDLRTGKKVGWGEMTRTGLRKPS